MGGSSNRAQGHHRAHRARNHTGQNQTRLRDLECSRVYLGGRSLACPRPGMCDHLHRQPNQPHLASVPDLQTTAVSRQTEHSESDRPGDARPQLRSHHLARELRPSPLSAKDPTRHAQSDDIAHASARPVLACATGRDHYQHFDHDSPAAALLYKWTLEALRADIGNSISRSSSASGWRRRDWCSVELHQRPLAT